MEGMKVVKVMNVHAPKHMSSPVLEMALTVSAPPSAPTCWKDVAVGSPRTSIVFKTEKEGTTA